MWFLALGIICLCSALTDGHPPVFFGWLLGLCFTNGFTLDQLLNGNRGKTVVEGIFESLYVGFVQCFDFMSR